MEANRKREFGETARAAGSPGVFRRDSFVNAPVSGFNDRTSMHCSCAAEQ
jgi:hypothetical protein